MREKSYNPYVINSTKDGSSQLRAERIPNSVLIFGTIFVLQNENENSVGTFTN